MTATQSRLLGLALLLAAIAFVVHLVKGGDAVDAAADRGVTQEALAWKSPLEESDAKARARFEAGAYVLRSTPLSDREDVQEIVIPEGYTEELDTRCVVYRNSELKTAAVTCNGIRFRPPGS